MKRINSLNDSSVLNFKKCWFKLHLSFRFDVHLIENKLFFVKFGLFMKWHIASLNLTTNHSGTSCYAATPTGGHPPFNFNLHWTLGKRTFFFDLCRCSMWTLNWILSEPIWKRCRFPCNINQPWFATQFGGYLRFTLKTCLEENCWMAKRYSTGKRQLRNYSRSSPQYHHK